MNCITVTRALDKVCEEVNTEAITGMAAAPAGNKFGAKTVIDFGTRKLAVLETAAQIKKMAARG